jgi:hypothetical protein
VYEEPPSSSLIQGGSRMRESRSYGSVRGAISDGRPYRNTQNISLRAADRPEVERRYFRHAIQDLFNP